MPSAALALTVPCPAAYDLGASHRTIWLSADDPTMRLYPGEVWRATRSPEGPATYRARRCSGGVEVCAWGPGAGWVAEHAPALLGLDDAPGSFEPRHPLVRELVRESQGMHLPRTLRIFERLVPTVLQQLIAWRDAMRAYRTLVLRLGEPAPGPGALWLPPSPAAIATLPDHVVVPHGGLPRHARTLRRAAERIAAIERLEHAAPERAREGLQAIPGIGPWTAAWTVAVSHGDPDTVLRGDLHLPRQVCWALAGERDGDDDRMEALLAPFLGHRWRVVCLLRRGGPRPPRERPRRPWRPETSRR